MDIQLLIIGTSVLIIYFLALYIFHLKNGFKKEIEKLNFFSSYQNTFGFTSFIRTLFFKNSFKSVKNELNSGDNTELKKDNKNIIDIKFFNILNLDKKNSYISENYIKVESDTEDVLGNGFDLKEKMAEKLKEAGEKLSGYHKLITECLEDDGESVESDVQDDDFIDEIGYEYADDIGNDYYGADVDYPLDDISGGESYTEPTEQEINSHIKNSNFNF